tara:strand:+ start:695 stop:1480 length:786 start_codon:yes stop_codon:yes gene_type:complete
MSDVYTFSQGTGPLLVSMPHVGLNVPADIGALLTEQAQALPDTDWYVDKLYDVLPDLGASTLRANHSRYVVDLNRAPDNSSLYPGQSVTEICPTTLFTCEPLYKPNCEPSAEQVRQRVEQYWLPYHQKISAELQRIKRQFGYALLWDAHSIKNQVPRFFEGTLPDFNWGNADGTASSPALAESMQQQIKAHGQYSSIINGRFKGGYITRHYGTPANHIYALQLELSQNTYMSADNSYCDKRAAQVKPLLKTLIEMMLTHGR